MKKLISHLILTILLPLSLYSSDKVEFCPPLRCTQAQTACIEQNDQIEKVIKVTLYSSPGCTIAGFAGQQYVFIIANSNNNELFSISSTIQGSNPQILTSPEIDQLEEGGTYQIWMTSSSGAKVNFSSNFIECSTSSDPFEKSLCCSGENLIQYNDFENHANSFPGGVPNSYNKETFFALGSVSPGEYALVNASQALNINPAWKVKDHTTCSNNGKILLINGETGQSDAKVAWKGAASLQPGRKYKFCANFKNLGVSSNDLKPKIDIKFSYGEEFNILGEEINTDISNPCAWKEVSKIISFSSPISVTVWIYLDETAQGTGNDLAIDDIAFIELEQCPASIANFNITTNIEDGYYTITASGEVSEDCTNPAWTVCQIDPVTMDCIEGTRIYNHSTWYADYETTNFPGYIDSDNISSGNMNPGRFEFSTFSNPKFYKITRGIYGKCSTWKQSSIIIMKLSSTNSTLKYTEKEFKAKRHQLLRKLRKPQKISNRKKR